MSTLTKSRAEPFHPDLRAARWIPLFSVSRRTLRLFRAAPRPHPSTAEFGIDPTRVAIGGASAGGGLAAALAQRLHDERGPQPRFQLLVYPMLDDRTVLRTDIDTRHLRFWSPASNRWGWESSLGVPAGAEVVPPYSVPARREDLTGLPPAWIGVGTLDIFHDEDLAYAQRLRAAGVACEVVEVSGAFHGFDATFSHTGVADRFRTQAAQALRRGLGG